MLGKIKVHDGEPATPAQRDLLQLIAENQPQARDGDDPEESAERIEDHETSHGHANRLETVPQYSGTPGQVLQSQSARRG
jgi:hypothetical protein